MHAMARLMRDGHCLNGWQQEVGGGGWRGRPGPLITNPIKAACCLREEDLLGSDSLARGGHLLITRAACRSSRREKT